MIFFGALKDFGVAGGIALPYFFEKAGEIILINKIVWIGDRRQQTTKSGGCIRKEKLYLPVHMKKSYFSVENIWKDTMLHSRSVLFSRNTFIIKILSNYYQIPCSDQLGSFHILYRKVGFSHTVISTVFSSTSSRLFRLLSPLLSPSLRILIIKNISSPFFEKIKQHYPSYHL